jgi:regulator of replication initiation timing
MMQINPQELPGLVEAVRTAAMLGLRHEMRVNLRKAADTLESLAAENERLTEENADLRNRLSRIVAC